MILLAIDPGPEKSAYVVYNGERVISSAKFENEFLVCCAECHFSNAEACKEAEPTHLAIEMVASYGMPVGKDVFDTALWVGRFVQAWIQVEPERWHTLVYRHEVKNHLCHDSRAKDANIRQALIDRFGGKDKAIGKKKTPGPLYGVKGDMWSALAVAITWWETKKVTNGGND